MPQVSHLSSLLSSGAGHLLLLLAPDQIFFCECSLTVRHVRLSPFLEEKSAHASKCELEDEVVHFIEKLKTKHD